MMKVFLDTNILLDFGLDREKADYLSYANMGYILRHQPVAERYELVRMMQFNYEG